MSEQRKILIVEDSPINRIILKEILIGEYDVLEAENGEEALKVLEEYGQEISLIVLDIIMPVMDGYTFLSVMKAKEACASIPVIVTTQSGGESDEVNALAHGATDFVAKPYKPQVILHRVANIIHLRETAAIINQVQYDHLTGLYSKEFFYQKANEILQRNPKKHYNIVCSDVENFKLINDVLGVPAGDRLLQAIAETYQQSVGDMGICGRFNADQFACLLEYSGEYTDDMFIKESERVKELSNIKNISLKWGIYNIHNRSVSIEQMCDRALLAARSIKGQYGKYYAHYDDTLRSKMLKEQSITNNMEAALQSGQFEVYLQPKYELQNDTLAGAEALVRWNHPEWGLQSPGEFIPLFEQNGFITQLDRYVWDRSCAIMRQWDDMGMPSVPVSVNVSRADIYNADLDEVLMQIMQKYRLEPSRLHLEITESAYTENPKQIIRMVERLHKQGFVIEMDDFGSGYSSLNLLNEMPVDVLKLDMKFIQSETQQPMKLGIMQFVINLAKWMKLKVVAEGVETKEQLECLRGIGCDYVQGYYFAKPMPQSEFEELLRKSRVAELQEPDPLMTGCGSKKQTNPPEESLPGGVGRRTITEEKKLQNRVRDLYEKELAYFAEASCDSESIQGRINLTKNRVESYIATSDVVVTHVGATYDETIENLAASAVDPAYGKEIRSTLNREAALKNYEAGNCEYYYAFLRRRKSGMFWGKTSFRLQMNPENGDIIIFFYTFDITEQKIREQLLGKMAKLDFDYVIDINIEKDHYRILTFNPGTQKRLPPEGAFQFEIRRHAKRYMDEKTTRIYLGNLDYDYMRRKLSKEESYTFSAEVKEDGIAEVKKYKVFYIDKDMGRVCLARTDVTDVVQQEHNQKEKLAEALTLAKQANTAKSDFLSRMSHEIRTPMNAIIGMNAIAAQSINDKEQVAECLKKMEVSSQFLLALINDILDMSRIESGKMLLRNETIDMKAFIGQVNSICSFQAKEKGIEYEWAVDSGVEDYYVGDAMKLEQVLLNIISNAMKFTMQGGKVSFFVSQEQKTEKEAVLRFVVSDTGVGMSEEFLPDIFEPFSQESTSITSIYGGTGLGLAISKGIVDMMNGRIEVCSTKGSGSKFTIDVRLETETKKGQSGGEEENPPSGRREYDFTGKRILLVEDNLINTEVATRLLTEKGFIVETAQNGLRAMERFGKSEEGYYSAILMDIRMPVMDGLTAAGNIRHLSNRDAGTIPIIAMTANAYAQDIEKSKNAGMNAHLAKPVNPEQLYQTLYRLISNHGEGE